MVSHGFSWFLMVSHGFSWFLMVSHGFSWFLMVSQAHSVHCFRIRNINIRKQQEEEKLENLYIEDGYGSMPHLKSYVLEN
jgi:hypothetical protein